MKLRYKILNGIGIFLGLAISALALTISYDSDCPADLPQTNNQPSMQAVLYHCYGSSEVLQLTTTAKPTPGDNEVLVKIHAAAVNPLDWHYMRGSPYIMRLGSGIGAPDDKKMGVDFSGVVEAVGKDVTKFQLGDQVFGGRGGAFAEYVVIPENRGIALKPDNITFEQAAGVPIAAITALQALRDHGNLQAGQKVLINGASGGVGTYAVQIAKSFGAEVSGVCSARNVDMVRSIGADQVFDYKTENYTQSGQTFDLIVDMIGNHSLSDNLEVLKPGGTIVTVGGAKGDWIAPLIGPLKIVIMAPFVDEQLKFFVAEMNQEDLVFLADLMQQGKMTTVIDSRYPLSDLRAAIAHSEKGHASGKIIVNVN